jgi:hypothetical protein
MTLSKRVVTYLPIAVALADVGLALYTELPQLLIAAIFFAGLVPYISYQRYYRQRRRS